MVPKVLLRLDHFLNLDVSNYKKPHPKTLEASLTGGPIHTSAPPQDDPDPAVQAKQCSPVTTRRIFRSNGLKDRMWSGAP
jgi:hypothetical protein